MPKQIIRSQSNNKVVGEVVDNVFIKKVVREKHFFRILRGYGIDKYILTLLASQGVSEIKIIEKDTGKTLIADVESFLKKGQFVSSEKYGDQLILNLNFFKNN